jgi:hypothetical protein
MPADPLLRQLSRIYGRPLDDPAAARAAIAAAPETLAAALVAEAAESDDVADTPAAIAYCEARLTELAPFVAGAAPAISAACRERIAAWATLG